MARFYLWLLQFTCCCGRFGSIQLREDLEQGKSELGDFLSEPSPFHLPWRAALPVGVGTLLILWFALRMTLY